MTIPSHGRALAALAAAAGLAAALAACGADSPDASEAPPAVPVVTAVVRPVEWRDTIEALGTARAKESVTMTAKVSEIVRKVAFDSGEVVREGDVLVDLSSGAQLAELEQTRAAYQEAERQHKRLQELEDEQLVSASQIDAQRAVRDAAKARMDVVRAQLSDRVITAPFDGVLGLRQVSPGSLVTPGTPIATLDDISVIKLDFSVPERYLAVLERGQQIAARSETWPGRDFEGTVMSVDSRVDPVTRSVTVRAEVPNPDRLLRPGMLMSVRLFQAPRETIVLPEIAVIQVGSDSFVFRVADDQTAERVEVELGSRRKGEVEIARGLAAGDVVVTEGSVKLRDGLRVAATPVEREGDAAAAAGEAS
jgi:membrane fusion protein, multidrug efflux system